MIKHTPNQKLRLKLFFLIILIIPTPLLNANEIAGILSYKDGEVEIVRNGSLIPEEEVFIGQNVENMDLIITKSDSFAEVDITNGAGSGSVVKIEPNTYCTIEINKMGKKTETNIGLITGTLAFKVKKLQKGEQFKIQSDAITLGIRGTQFKVTSPPTGNFLITCNEGLVLCTDDRGETLYAKPGQVVEKKVGQIFRTIPVAVSNLENFRRDWYAEEIEVFKSNALKAIRYYALRYNKLLKDFNNAYSELIKENRILNKWIIEDKNNKIGTKIEVMREKKRIIGHLFRLRKVLFIFERIYFRLSELENYFREGYGRGYISSGVTTTEFFRQFEKDRINLIKQMSFVRYVFKLYSNRNNGYVPGGIIKSDTSDNFNSDFDDDSFDKEIDEDF